MRTRPFLIGILLVASLSASAQSISPPNRFTLQGPADHLNVPKDAFGKPCLDVEAGARAQVVNPTMVDHIVSAKNNCPRRITVSICYFHSDNCRQAIIQPYKRVDTVLGTMRGVTAFRYSIDQK